jgi:hypothetical protein
MPDNKAYRHKLQILIDFPRQQLLRERSSMLRYTNFACLVIYVKTLEKDKQLREGSISV